MDVLAEVLDYFLTNEFVWSADGLVFRELVHLCFGRVMVVVGGRILLWAWLAHQVGAARTAPPYSWISVEAGAPSVFESCLGRCEQRRRRFLMDYSILFLAGSPGFAP